MAVKGSTATVFTTSDYSKGAGNCLIYPLLPQDSSLFPAAYATAAQYNYYRWGHVQVDFNSIKGTSTVGRIGIAVTSNYETAISLKDWSSFNSLPHSITDNVYGSELEFLTSPGDMNQQFSDTGYKIDTIQSVQMDDSSKNQGFIVVAITDCVDTSVCGNLTFSYELELSVPHEPTSLETAKHDQFRFFTAGAAVANAFFEAYDAPFPSAHFVNPPYTCVDSGGGVATVTGSHKGLTIMQFSIFGAAFPTVAVAAVDGCVVELVHMIPSTDATLRHYVYFIRSYNAYHTFTVTQTNNSTGIYGTFCPLPINMLTIARSWWP